MTMLAVLIVAYIISPIDIIPDFIPVIGLLDEVILVPIFLAFTVKMIPVAIRHEYEQTEIETEDQKIEDRRLSIFGTVMIIIVWGVLLGLCVQIITE